MIDFAEAHLDCGVICPSCYLVMPHGDAVNSIACRTMNCDLYGVHFARPTVRLKRIDDV